MNKVKESYRSWSKVYDSNKNKTRDLDEEISKKNLSKLTFNTVLEIGCGTGKNTQWLSQKARHIIAVDFSPEMLLIAREKVPDDHVVFLERDITKKWDFAENPVDLITINLVLEHLEDLDVVFKNCHSKLKKGGYLYISELHPCKHLLGSQARFGEELVKSYRHPISTYFHLAKKHHLTCMDLVESFDTQPKKNEEHIPRLISFLFVKI